VVNATKGNTTKVQTAYQYLFTLWKDTDTGVPILKEVSAG
jgi:hypothetical protein